MLKRLADLAKQGKEIWGFLALVAGLGVSYGKLSSRLDGVGRDVDKVERSVKEMRRETGRRFDQVDDRFDRAHDVVERRLGSSDLIVMGLRDTVTRLIILDEVRDRRRSQVAAGGGGHPPDYALAPSLAPPNLPAIEELPPALQVKRARDDLRDSVQRSIKHRPPVQGALPRF